MLELVKQSDSKAFAASLLLLSLPLLAADQNKQLTEKLEKDLSGHVLIIRNFYTAARLSYDANGNLLGTGGQSDWMQAQLEPKKIKISGDSVTIRGPRVRTVYLGDGSSFLNYPQKKEEVTVILQLPSESPTEDQIRAAFAHAFLSSTDRLENLVPSEWKSRLHAACPIDPSTAPSLQDSRGAIKPPHVIYSPDPQYSEYARSNRVQGTVQLDGILDVDGKMKCLAVGKSVGYGLDERAIFAVRNWIFQPATKNGEPLPIKLKVEVNFRLY